MRAPQTSLKFLSEQRIFGSRTQNIRSLQHFFSKRARRIDILWNEKLLGRKEGKQSFSVLQKIAMRRGRKGKYLGRSFRWMVFRYSERYPPAAPSSARVTVMSQSQSFRGSHSWVLTYSESLPSLITNSAFHRFEMWRGCSMEFFFIMSVF